ncbi:MAG: oligoendopeptidase F [Mycoplasmoidaceae bacterium]
MKNKYNWDLEDILENETLDALYEKWKKSIDKILRMHKTFYLSLENFIKFHEEREKNTVLTNKIFNYISNNLNEDTANSTWLSWSQKLKNDVQNYSEATSDEENIIIENEKKIREYLKDPRLKEYIRIYELFFKNKKRILSKKEEKLLSQLSKTSSAFEDIYSSVVDTTIKYYDVKDKNNKKVKLESMAKVYKSLKSSDRVLRKNAWISFNKAYYDNRYILTNTLYYNYLDLNQSAKIRKYKDYVESSCDNDEVNRDFLLNIYKGVESFAPIYKNFSSSRNKILKAIYGLKKIYPWDKNISIVKRINDNYTIEKIQTELLKVFRCFGKEYTNIVEKAFNENWISWLPKKNKHSGAYSIGGTQGLKKYYISMNFDKTIRSLYTASHELGHSLHSYYINQNQKVHTSCSIFYAEIASITNEMLLSYYLLENTKSDDEKIYILDEVINGFFSTTTRQIIFSNFEYEIIEKLNKNLPITFETITETYKDMNEKYTGFKKRKNVKEPLLYSLSTILRIDHFYIGNFYVYKYAIGQICAIIISRKIYDGDKDAIKRYFDFLKSGSSLSPIDTIKLLGIDFSKKELWDECFANINDLIAQFNKITLKYM